MSLLDTITKPAERPAIITITGDAGMGKTSLAATFPKPIFIRVEDGLQSLPIERRPDAFPVVGCVADLHQQLLALSNEDHDYKTVVIDSVTRLETMFVQHVVDTDPNKPKSINQALGGYGAGLAKVASLHGMVRKAAEKMNNKGMHVIFIAHSDTETVDLADQEPYMRNSLRLSNKSKSHYIDDVDMVAMIKHEFFLKGDPEKTRKAISQGKRVVSVKSTPSSVTKNRYGIEQYLPFEAGKNPFINVIPSLKTMSSEE